jgi:hypothetical protein
MRLECLIAKHVTTFFILQVDLGFSTVDQINPLKKRNYKLGLCGGTAFAALDLKIPLKGGKGQMKRCLLRYWGMKTVMSMMLPMLLLLLMSPVRVVAQESGTEEVMKQVADLKIATDTVWVLVTALMVFFMNLGTRHRPGDSMAEAQAVRHIIQPVNFSI